MRLGKELRHLGSPELALRPLRNFRFQVLVEFAHLDPPIGIPVRAVVRLTSERLEEVVGKETMALLLEAMSDLVLGGRSQNDGRSFRIAARRWNHGPFDSRAGP